RCATYPLASLVHRDRLEDVVPTTVAFRYVLDARGRGDLVARDHQWPPLELLTAVDHHGEVDLRVGVEYGRPNRGRAVDHGEHRRRHDVLVAGRTRRLDVHMNGVSLPHHAGILLDLLPAHRVQRGLVGLADRLCADGHPTRLLGGTRTAFLIQTLRRSGMAAAPLGGAQVRCPAVTL